MSVPTPDWLTQRSCEMKKSADGHAYTIYLGGHPQYLLIPIPAGGKYACRVSQTINGKRFDVGTTFATNDDAVRGGLEDLRKSLGW